MGVLKEIKKAVVAGCGVLSIAVAQGVIPEPYRGWAVAVLAVATTFGVYQARNEPAAGP